MNKQLVSLATLCGFKNPEKNTAHSKRKYAITLLNAAPEEIGHQNMKLAARHKSDDANRVYQQSAPVIHDRRIRAMWGSGIINEDDKTGEYLESFSCALLFII